MKIGARVLVKRLAAPMGRRSGSRICSTAYYAYDLVEALSVIASLRQMNERERQIGSVFYRPTSFWIERRGKSARVAR